ncbi:cAMP-dependent protein kinase regulatory subunit BCY1 Ecym_1142 [Eremothecium cymbalariae DBVPG|uniref:Cyclic nucleotide-binding domain-containing protein n=1 Tax=Eremothecium cymbalariae (strain CBS 270.75 / DBVPG 7215 / KCTC 17166 / NRRL Y-17582) TaxID=931890 RepID=G8JMN9_ERECY|nr:hypothetical protein Ecym_1142 [Eremothecium cymbalariae DBVPG\
MYTNKSRQTHPHRRSLLSNVVRFSDSSLGMESEKYGFSIVQCKSGVASYSREVSHGNTGVLVPQWMHKCMQREGVVYDDTVVQKRQHKEEDSTEVDVLKKTRLGIEVSENGRISNKYEDVVETSKGYMTTDEKCNYISKKAPNYDGAYENETECYVSDDPWAVSQLDNISPFSLEKLMSFSLFQNASQAFYVSIARKLKLVTYHAQQYILKAGESARTMYWILKGAVNVISPDGETIHAELVEGFYFGEIGILFNRPRTATVVAKSQLLVGVLTAENFEQLLTDYPSVERQIRDEAQERLARQGKKRKACITNIIDQNLNTLDANHEGYSSFTEQEGLTLQLKTPESVPNHGFAQPNQLTLSFVNIDDSVSTHQFLKSIPLFTTLPKDILHSLALCVDIKKFQPFQYIFRKGDYGNDVYFVLSGEVEVLNHDPDVDSRSTKVLAKFGPGQYFGEKGVLNSVCDIEPISHSTCTRSVDIRSVSECSLLVLTGETLTEFCKRYPWIRQEIKKTSEERSTPKLKAGPQNITSIGASITVHETMEVPNKTESLLKLLPNSRNNDLQSASEIYDVSDHSIYYSSTQKSPHDVTSRISFDRNFSLNSRIKKLKPKSLSQRLKVSKTVPSTSRSMSPLSLQICSISKLSAGGTDTCNCHPVDVGAPELNSRLDSRKLLSASSTDSVQHMPQLKKIKLLDLAVSAKESNLPKVSVGSLPDRLLLRCFQFLSLPELMKLRFVCRKWRQLLYVASGLFDELDLTPWNKSIDDKALMQISDFVGSRPKSIDISNCYHLTDNGFSYMINETCIGGQLRKLKMRSCWEISAMAIMDVAAPSIGRILNEIDLSNCRKVRDDVIQRLIGWENTMLSTSVSTTNAPDCFEHENGRASDKNDNLKPIYQIDKPTIATEAFDGNASCRPNVIGCQNLHTLILRYCKNITDLTLYHISIYGKDRLSYIDLTRCTGLTNSGFTYWSYQSFLNLHTLILSECIFLTDSGIRSIANCTPNLQNLNLSFCCSLTDVAIELLWIGCPNLRTLDLSFCGRAVSNVSLLGISMHLRKLHNIVLKGCLRVTRSGVDSLLGGFAPLTFIDISQCKNAHMYQGGLPAIKFELEPGCKSIFLTVEDSGRCIEVVI